MYDDAMCDMTYAYDLPLSFTIITIAGRIDFGARLTYRLQGYKPQSPRTRCGAIISTLNVPKPQSPGTRCRAITSTPNIFGCTYLCV